MADLRHILLDGEYREISEKTYDGISGLHLAIMVLKWKLWLPSTFRLMSRGKSSN